MFRWLGKNEVRKPYGRASTKDTLGAYLLNYLYKFFVGVYILKIPSHHFSLFPICINIFSPTK